MVRFGRFRIVPTVREGRAVFEVKSMPGNISFGIFNSKGKAASQALKLDRAEKAGRKALSFAKQAGLRFGKISLKFIRQKTKPKSRRRKTKRRRKR